MKAIARTIELLQKSHDSLYARMNTNEAIATLRIIQAQFEQTGQVDKAQLSLLFGPTGSIQEISIYNGWGEELLVLSQMIDQTTA